MHRFVFHTFEIVNFVNNKNKKHDQPKHTTDMVRTNSIAQNNAQHVSHKMCRTTFSNNVFPTSQIPLFLTPSEGIFYITGVNALPTPKLFFRYNELRFVFARLSRFIFCCFGHLLGFRMFHLETATLVKCSRD